MLPSVPKLIQTSFLSHLALYSFIVVVFVVVVVAVAAAVVVVV